MKKSIVQVLAYKGEDDYFFASCTDLGMVTQGATLDELASNIQEAVELALEDEDMDEFGYTENPTILVTL